ncbi:MAG: hypothetical protein H6742_07480 [Alphaproteobacteria bacterium]|nr:hypothetical protein [Alphaproteobacteria bacterium]
MLIENRLDDETSVFIDVEIAGGFARGEDDYGFHPDQILNNVVKVSSLVASKLAESAQQTAEKHEAPSRLTLEFGLKIDANSVVCIANNSQAAHFKVVAEWAPRRD